MDDAIFMTGYNNMANLIEVVKARFELSVPSF